MKRFISIFLSCAVLIASFMIGITEIGKNVTEKVENKQIEKLYNETVSLTGEIENRVVVKCRKKLDSMGAVQTASGYDNMQIFQYETKEQADRAYQYYSGLDYVESVDFDKRILPCGDEFLDNDDAKCYATASDNIDDMIKLINENYSNFPEIKIAVIDSGCEDNELTHNAVQNLGNTVGADNDHGTKVCGTIIYNTLGNVKIYSYDVGDADGFSNVSCTSAMYKAKSDGCKIINMSYGSYESNTNENNAVNSIYNSKIIMVAAAGNDNKKLTSSVQHYPSCYSKVIGIGALNEMRDKASFSNYGTGVNYYTVGRAVRSYQGSSDIVWAGTSAATPVAVSIIANMLSVDSSLDFTKLKSIIKTSTSHNNTSSYGYIDGYSTLSSYINKTLPQANFTYDLNKNDATGFSDITFHCDKDIRIYCQKNSTSKLAINNSVRSSGCYKNGDTLSLDCSSTINAVAYGDGMRKSTEKVITAPEFNGNGYTYKAASCELTDCQYIYDSIIEVPAMFEGNPVTSVGIAAFAGNPNAETIILPKSVTNVGAYAFANCPKLKKVIAPGVKTLGRFAFENSDNLLFTYFPNVSNIYKCALAYCKELTAVDVGSLSNISIISTSVFFNSNNIIDWQNKSHLYDFEKISDDGTVTYVCTKCNTYEPITISADLLIEMWSPYIVGRTINTTNYDSLFLFDVTGDNVINAKDYSVINNLIQKQ